MGEKQVAAADHAHRGSFAVQAVFHPVGPGLPR